MSKLIGIRIVHKPDSAIPHYLQFLYSSGGLIGMQYDPKALSQVFEIPSEDLSDEEQAVLDNFKKDK